ncbi:MAG: NAD(+) synthase [Candidatus Pacebacteria bacterium]|nr:NAD(+) synthase [Candidatus Paceibacterota bacterium]
MKPKNKTFGFLRVTAFSPEVIIGNTELTTTRMLETMQNCAEKRVKLLVFPELCLAGGYSNADLFHQSLLQTETLSNLERLVCQSVNLDIVTIVGMPLAVNGSLYNVAVVIDRGHIVGIVPKTYLPSGAEFYEARWFANAHDLTVKEITLFGKTIPIGIDLLFESKEDSSVVLGIEICEDVWTPLPPSSFQAVAGATVIANLSASNELVGKADYRRQLITQQSGRCIAGYIYSSAGAGESTTDVVFSGHCIIAENGSIVRESERLQNGPTSVIADLDIEACVHDRQRTTSFAKCSHELAHRPAYRRILVGLPTNAPDHLARTVSAHPFIPSNDADKHQVCSDIFGIQSLGLAQRLKKSHSGVAVIGISGGLDSTLALLVCIKAFKLLGLDFKEKIKGYTMPGFGTTAGTKSNAFLLAEAAGIALEEVPISAGSIQILNDIGHDGTTEDITFENAQARYRTLVLMQKANQLGGMVIGTGDLSESALGWATYNGDHMSHYNVNGSVPKTLVGFITRWVAENEATPAMRKVLEAILDTPVSPELTSAKEGEIAQKTEDIIGPYELHDFFLYHFQRKGASPQKIAYLATIAFRGKYSRETIVKWLKVFIIRFFKNQFKRSAVPDGPKVGSVALSPRGDWRMPSDACSDQWLADLE